MKETKTYYQVKADGKFFYKHFKTLEEARETARSFANQMKYEKVEIVLIKAELESVERVSPTPLYKMF